MPKNCIGLDIGTSTVKIVQLRAGKRGVQLVNFGIEPVPPQSIVDGSVMNSASVAEAIRSLSKRLSLRQREVAVAIAGHSVIIKKISVPVMTVDELEEQIHWEAEHHIPFAKDDVEIDHQVLKTEHGQNQMDVLLVAAKKEVVADYATTVRDAQVVPVVMDVAAFALQNCFELNYGRPTEPIALINVGAAIATIHILVDGQSAFTRDVTIGGNAFTDEIQKRLGVSHDVAEAYKCGGTAGDEVVPQGVDEILAGQAEVMAGEFQRSFDFYLATTADGSLSRIYLSGGGSRVPALARAIERRARIPVEALNPFRNVQVDEKAFDIEYITTNAPMAAVGVGLALRVQGDR
jgi:type IV pilus assembly protein PilM